MFAIIRIETLAKYPLHEANVCEQKPIRREEIKRIVNRFESD